MMQLIRGIHNIRSEHQGGVVAIGNFDGVHRGHQAIIAQCVKVATELHVPSTVMLFEPQPREFFEGEFAPGRLMTWREKASQIAGLGVKQVLVVPFNQRVADSEPIMFIEEVLVHGLRAKMLVVGEDFRFGRNRQGDFALLQEFGKRHNFSVLVPPCVEHGGIRISSSAIRKALADCDLETAQLLLGRHYQISGRVCHGDKRGAKIGFPTANIRLQRQRPALTGVFAAKVYGINEGSLPAAVNLGKRPTVDGTRYWLEVHVLDFSGDLYGKHLSIEFCYAIRPERPFSSIEALQAQLQVDVAEARELLAG